MSKKIEKIIKVKDKGQAIMIIGIIKIICKRAKILLL